VLKLFWAKTEFDLEGELFARLHSLGQNMRADHRKWHFGVLSFTGTGHLNPFLALSQELKARGHKVTFFEKPKIEGRVRQAGLEFVPVGANLATASNAPPNDPSGIRSEIAMLRFNLARVKRDIGQYLQEMPAALSRAGVDALLINEIAFTGPTVAQALRLPYFLISTSVPHHFGWKTSSWFTGYRYSATSLSWLQGVLLELSVLRMRGPVRRALDAHRRRLGLGTVHAIPAEFPCLAHITQLPQCVDLPRRLAQKNFHYTGIFASRDGRPQTEFPWDRLDGRPIIYASLGTTRNVQPAVFKMIAEACRELDAQLVISLGNRFEPEMFSNLPGRPVVVRFAPQLELLKVAQVAITHSGPNSAFEALAEGKPMVVIPFAYDQPAIAARLKRLHVAEMLPIMRLSAKRIREAVAKVLGNVSYRVAAEAVQSNLRSICGRERAADIVERGLDEYAANMQHIQCRAGEESFSLKPSAFQISSVRRSSILKPSSSP
jgi:MGT family glycosyltransferase